MTHCKPVNKQEDVTKYILFLENHRYLHRVKGMIVFYSLVGPQRSSFPANAAQTHFHVM